MTARLGVAIAGLSVALIGYAAWILRELAGEEWIKA